MFTVVLGTTSSWNMKVKAPKRIRRNICFSEVVCLMSQMSYDREWKRNIFHSIFNILSFNIPIPSRLNQSQLSRQKILTSLSESKYSELEYYFFLSNIPISIINIHIRTIIFILIFQLPPPIMSQLISPCNR